MALILLPAPLLQGLAALKSVLRPYLAVWGGSWLNWPLGAAAMRGCSVSSASRCACHCQFLYGSSHVVSSNPFHSVSASGISGKSLSLPVLHNLSGLYDDSEEWYLFTKKKPLHCFWKYCPVPPSLLNCVPQHFFNILSHLNLFLKALVLKFEKRGGGDWETAFSVHFPTLVLQKDYSFLVKL